MKDQHHFVVYFVTQLYFTELKEYLRLLLDFPLTLLLMHSQTLTLSRGVSVISLSSVLNLLKVLGSGRIKYR